MRKALLIGIVFSAIVMAAPAAAQAGPEWYEVPETTIGNVTEAKEFNTEVIQLRFTFNGFVSGYCLLSAHGFVWNGEEMGNGAIDQFFGNEECGTSVPFCKVEKISSSASAEVPWNLTLVGANEVELQNITLTYHYTPGCKAFLGTTTVSIAGNLSGPFNNGSQCIEYTAATGLKIELTEAPVKAEGAICFGRFEVL